MRGRGRNSGRYYLTVDCSTVDQRHRPLTRFVLLDSGRCCVFVLAGVVSGTYRSTEQLLERDDAGQLLSSFWWRMCRWSTRFFLFSRLLGLTLIFLASLSSFFALICSASLSSLLSSFFFLGLTTLPPPLITPCCLRSKLAVCVLTLGRPG
jgi:hypothetical protein